MSDESDTVQDASEPFRFRRWLRTVSYVKIHAVVYGMFLLFVAAMASSVYVLAGFVSIALWALGVRASPFRYTVSGEKKDDENDDPRSHTKVFDEIRQKPHYFLGGGAVGDLIGRGGYYLIHGTQPDHWDHLPEVIGQLFLGVA